MRLVERLLASPRYGERWGRHWLDVARYSDTKGYVYGREERRFVHAPAYRDWVIRAFNDDLPYDRFLLLQIAADRLVPPGSPDLAVMGFITGGRRFIGVTHDIIDDRIDAATRGTMGLTVQCARCHDHKYDPIPIEDYYSLYGGVPWVLGRPAGAAGGRPGCRIGQAREGAVRDHGQAAFGGGRTPAESGSESTSRPSSNWRSIPRRDSTKDPYPRTT